MNVISAFAKQIKKLKFGQLFLKEEITLKQRFTEVYHKNLWGDDQSRSGPGSNRNSNDVKHSIVVLEKISQKYNIKSIADIPCGDFNWMYEFLDNNKHIDYTGYDIVDKVVKSNEASNYSFKQLDITSDVPEAADLIFCKDLFNHLTYSQIQRAVKNMKLSNSTYLLASNNFNYLDNVELVNAIRGASRHFDFMVEPFNYPEPLWHDHYLGLWKLRDLT